MTHIISSLLTHWRDLLSIHPSVSHAELPIPITGSKDLFSSVRKAGFGTFYPWSRLLIIRTELFVNDNSVQSGKISFCFQFVLTSSTW